MDLERAKESLKAAQLCLDAGFENSASSRAYYAMFQCAQVALTRAGVSRTTWSHPALQAAFATELVHRRKAYPLVFRDYLSAGRAGVSHKVAGRQVRRATSFFRAVEEGEGHE